LTIYGQYLVQNYFATLDEKRFLLSDIAQDSPVFTGMLVPTQARTFKGHLTQKSSNAIFWWNLIKYVTMNTPVKFFRTAS